MQIFSIIITYRGHLFSLRGTKESNENNGLKSGLGMVNCYGKFFKKLESKSHPWYRLFKKDVDFVFNLDCGKASK